MFLRSLHRNLFDYYKQTDTIANPDESKKLTMKRVGTVEVRDDGDNEILSLPLVLFAEDIETPAALIKTTNDVILVGLNQDYYKRTLSNNRLSLILASIAHECGHFLAGHMSPERHNELDHPDINTAKIVSLYQKAIDGQDPADDNRYYRSVMNSLLRGAVLKKEYEADLIAVKMCTVQDLIFKHSQDLDKASGPFVRLEKANRIAKLHREVVSKKTEEITWTLIIRISEADQDESQTSTLG